MLKYFPSSFSAKSLMTYFFTLVLLSLIYYNHHLNWIWLVFGISEVILFFFALNSATREWKTSHEDDLLKHLFWWSFLIRVAYVFFSYYFYMYHTKQPFEFEAGDALGYHEEGYMILDWARHGDYSKFFTSYKYEFSDMGYSIWLAICYFPTYNSIIFARIMNALISSLMVLLIYKLAKRNFDKDTARISAVIAVFLPSFIYYCGLHLKETVMVFFLMSFIERADYMIRSPKFKFWNIIMVVFLGLSLFFFRTVLAIPAWIGLILGLLYTRSRFVSHGNRLIYIVMLIVMAGVLFSGRIEYEITKYSKARGTNQQSQMDNFTDREGGNSLARYGSTVIFAPLVFIAPFPTMVQINIQRNSMMINGNVFVKNVISFFFILGLITLYKQKKLKDNILILSVLFSYMAVLALSGFALSERFHFPTLPFIIILAGFGITQMKPKTVKYFDYYLFGLILLIIAWNWFKLAGRGLA